MNDYILMALCFDKWHRAFFGYIKYFLAQRKIFDLSAQQLMILYHISDKVLRVTEVLYSDFYFGSNPSYSIKKMIRCGYLTEVICEEDKRIVMIESSLKGKSIVSQLSDFLQESTLKSFEGHFEMQNIKNFIPLGEALCEFWKGKNKLIGFEGNNYFSGRNSN